MAKVSKKLLRALESDCAADLCQVIKEAKHEDFEALQTFLSSDPSIKPEHRTKAIHALGRWGDPAPVTTIRSILPQLDEAGRISAIDALGRLGTREALRGVLDYVDDSSPHVRKFVTRALGRINTPEARAKLKEIKTKDPVDYIRALASDRLLMAHEDKWEFYKDSAGEWRWRRTAPNGRIVGASTEGYHNKSDCEDNARRNGWSGH